MMIRNNNPAFGDAGPFEELCELIRDEFSASLKIDEDNDDIYIYKSIERESNKRC